MMSCQVGRAYSPHWNGENTGARRLKSNSEIICIPARAMKITWGRDPRFWKWIQLPRDKLPRDISRHDQFGPTASVAELVQVNWLEATGSLDLADQQLSPSKTYEVVFHVEFRADAFGWSKSPVTLVVVGPGGRRETRRVAMEPYRGRAEAWHEIHAGEFRLQAPPGGGAKGGCINRVEFGMFDVNSQGWKGGVVLAGVTIRPSNSRAQQANDGQMASSCGNRQSRSRFY